MNSSVVGVVGAGVMGVGVAQSLAQTGYRVIIPYLRGYGTTRFLADDTIRNGQPSALAADIIVSAQDGKFVRASAVVDGETIVVSAAGVSAPTQVRFGWHKTTNPNLINQAGLPAAPFQTNNWQGGTGE